MIDHSRRFGNILTYFYVFTVMEQRMDWNYTRNMQYLDTSQTHCDKKTTKKKQKTEMPLQYG